jgi:hypothetical protein
MLYALFWVIPRRLNFICHIKFRRPEITQKKAYKIYTVCIALDSPGFKKYSEEGRVSAGEYILAILKF